MPRKSDKKSSLESYDNTDERDMPVNQNVIVGSPPTKTNAWVQYVKSISEKEGCSYKTAMSIAKQSYKKN